MGWPLSWRSMRIPLPGPENQRNNDAFFVSEPAAPGHVARPSRAEGRGQRGVMLRRFLAQFFINLAIPRRGAGPQSDPAESRAAARSSFLAFDH